MPVAIAIASVMGLILTIWLIKRSRAKPKVEFRQDTMRYITIDPDKRKRNQELQTQMQHEALPEEANISPAAETERVVSKDETPEMQVALKPVLADAHHEQQPEELLEVHESSEQGFTSPDLLLSDER